MEKDKRLKTNSIHKNDKPGKPSLYQSVVLQSPFGFALFQVDYTENKQIIDLKFIEVNKSFETLTGLKAETVIGKTLAEVFPELNAVKDKWIKVPVEVNKHKRFKEMNHFMETTKRWLHLIIYFPSKVQIVIQFHDISLGLNQDRTEFEQILKEKSTLIETILDNAPAGIWITYPSNSSFFANKYVEDNFAMTEEESLQCVITDQDALEKDSPQHYDEVVTFKDGKKHILETIKTKIHREDGSILGILGFGLDITGKKEGEEALRISESKYRLLTETTSDVIWVMNLKSKKITYISPTIQILIGYTVEEIIEKSFEEIMAPESYDRVVYTIEKALESFMKNPNLAKSFIIETELCNKKGKFIWSEISAQLRYNVNQEIEVVGVSRNIEKRKKFEKEVLYLSYHDQLTGLYNRRYYEEELKRINLEDNYPITLVMADLNGLKLTNDAFGHVLGDKLLITFADILRKECRLGDIIARIGGDEFVILLPRANSIQAEKIVERIHSIVNKTMIDKVMLSVSFGWKTKYMKEEEFDEIYKQAEDAMYRRKLLEGKSYKSDTIKLITKSLYEKSPKEQIHSERVSMLCKNIGIAMGMSSDDINELGLIGLLHDIGKIGIDEQILNKPGKLSEEEWKEMKRHPEIGYHILGSVNEFADIAQYVLAHHERMDGKGYPNGISAEEIPLKSKILFVAEAFEEMTGGYKYKDALSIPSAVYELKKNSGLQFDNETVRIFVEKVLKEK